MIFLGDIAIPENATPNFKVLPRAFQNQIVVANLEGAIITNSASSIKETKLYSNSNVIDYLKKWNVKAVSIANNHITDYPEAFEDTKRILNENGIMFFGAGKTIDEAKKPLILEENGEKYALIAFGWDVISCKYPKNGQVGINPLEVEHIISCIEEIKTNYSEHRIIVLPHWNYELEKYPMPAHRILAQKLIDLGAYAIVGHHPHCVQGIELYAGKPIVYSLGNWFIPQGVYMSGRLKFPDYANLECAVEIINGAIELHWFKYDRKEHVLNFIEIESLNKSEKIKILTPYTGMSKEQYYYWFKKHRVKRKALPIYESCDSNIANIFKDIWVNIRQLMLNILFRVKLRERNDVNR